MRMRNKTLWCTGIAVVARLAWMIEAKTSQNQILYMYSIFVSLIRTTFIYAKHLRCGEYLSEREKGTFGSRERERQKEWLLFPQMKWLCGWMYMWVQAAMSCEWVVGTEWEEKSSFSETISTKACWKAVTLSWLLFCFLHLYKNRVPGSEVGDG